MHSQLHTKPVLYHVRILGIDTSILLLVHHRSPFFLPWPHLHILLDAVVTRVLNPLRASTSLQLYPAFQIASLVFRTFWLVLKWNSLTTAITALNTQSIKFDVRLAWVRNGQCSFTPTPRHSSSVNTPRDLISLSTFALPLIQQNYINIFLDPTSTHAWMHSASTQGGRATKPTHIFTHLVVDLSHIFWTTFISKFHYF